MRHFSLMAAIIVGGCAMSSGHSSPVIVCPPVVDYTPEFQAQMADELQLVPADGAVVTAMSDYGLMRNQARACWPDGVRQ